MTQIKVRHPFRTSLAWHLARVVAKLVEQALEEVWKCLK